MTKEEIIEMARQSAFTRHWEYEKCLVCNPDSLYHFAKLIAEKEREECAKMFEKSPALLECAKNALEGCLICGFTPELAINAIRARGQE